MERYQQRWEEDLKSERFNGTLRERLASLTRKCSHASAHLEPFQWGMYLIDCTYNLCWIRDQ